MNRDEWRVWMDLLQKDRKRVELRALVAPDGLLGGLVLPETIALMVDDDSEIFELASERVIRTRRQKRQEIADGVAKAKRRAIYGDWQDLSLEGW
jgi:hypothetical protein